MTRMKFNCLAEQISSYEDNLGSTLAAAVNRQKSGVRQSAECTF